MSQPKLFLLDGHALVYRAHYAFVNRPLRNSKGLNVSAATGFVNTLWDVLQNEKPSHLAVVFDPPGGTFRNALFEAYKANREETPQDIILAVPMIKTILEAFNIPILEVPNFEADDVIGTVAKQAEREGFQVFMMTPDKDYGQLVSPNIFLYKPSRTGNGVEVLGEKEICEVWGIQRVSQVIDMLGLQGDSVDNIPGIPGIGGKTAAKLLEEFDTVENLIANANRLKGKQKEKVIEFAEQGLLSKRLATIDIAVPVFFDATACKVKGFNREALKRVFDALEFRQIAQRILGESAVIAPSTTTGKQQMLFGEPAPTDSPANTFTSPPVSIASQNIENTQQDYRLVNTTEKRLELIKLLSASLAFCFDTETTGLDPNEAELVGMSFSVRTQEAFYVPVPAVQAEAKLLVAEFKKLLESPQHLKIGQNIKYDALMLKWYGVEISEPFFDTMLAHYLVEPDLRHNLDYLSEVYLNYQKITTESLIGKKGKLQLSMRDLPVEKVAVYAAEDADITLRLRGLLEDKLQEHSLKELFEKVETPLIKVLTDMEYEGVRVDAGFLGEYSVVLAKDIEAREKLIYQKAGVPFNINSPKQVGEVLFDRLKLPYRWQKTATGQYSTNEEKLAEMAGEFEIVNDILEHRKLQKLKSTYADALPQMVNPKTGRIHTSYNQARAATGRLSSEQPNLQNIPIKDEAGREIRKAFLPRNDEYVLLAADYSQIELRLIAHISNDEAMLNAFNQQLDIHRATAAGVYGVSLDAVTPEQRRNAKTVNFSIIYGAGSLNLSRQLGISRADAKTLIDQYFNQYKGLQNYMAQVVEQARETGFVTTLMGRRRYLPDIHSKSSLQRSNAERIAINMPIQGTAADMIKLAMIDIYHTFKQEGFRSKMILQVHDELVFDVYRPELETVQPLISKAMQNALQGLNVPILVETGTGENWLEAH